MHQVVKAVDESKNLATHRFIESSTEKYLMKILMRSFWFKDSKSGMILNSSFGGLAKNFQGSNLQNSRFSGNWSGVDIKKSSKKFFGKSFGEYFKSRSRLNRTCSKLSLSEIEVWSRTFRIVSSSSQNDSISSRKIRSGSNEFSWKSSQQ